MLPASLIYLILNTLWILQISLFQDFSKLDVKFYLGLCTMIINYTNPSQHEVTYFYQNNF